MSSLNILETSYVLIIYKYFLLEDLFFLKGMFN